MSVYLHFFVRQNSQPAFVDNEIAEKFEFLMSDQYGFTSLGFKISQDFNRITGLSWVMLILWTVYLFCSIRDSGMFVNNQAYCCGICLFVI